MSTTTNKNSSNKSSKAFNNMIKLNASNALAVQETAKKLKRSPDFIVNALLDKTELVPTVKKSKK